MWLNRLTFNLILTKSHTNHFSVNQTFINISEGVLLSILLKLFPVIFGKTSDFFMLPVPIWKFLKISQNTSAFVTNSSHSKPRWRKSLGNKANLEWKQIFWKLILFGCHTMMHCTDWRKLPLNSPYFVYFFIRKKDGVHCKVTKGEFLKTDTENKFVYMYSRNPILPPKNFTFSDFSDFLTIIYIFESWLTSYVP